MTVHSIRVNMNVLYKLAIMMFYLFEKKKEDGYMCTKVYSNMKHE
jgi:hypothetical protein